MGIKFNAVEYNTMTEKEWLMVFTNRLREYHKYEGPLDEVYIHSLFVIGSRPEAAANDYFNEQNRESKYLKFKE